MSASKTEQPSRSRLLGSSALMMALSLSAQAQTQPGETCTDANGKSQPCPLASSVAEASKEIEVVEVFGVSGTRYLAERSGDQRRAADLAGTPATLNILTQSQILDSGKTDLKEILSSQAGVTLGTGENGNAFGDRYIIRGHEARSDVFVDGLRDPGMTTRESFATEQVEIAKGPSATFAGRGTSGGAVNSITKGALLGESFNILDAGVGTDDHYRLTFDSNLNLTADTALRLNLLTGSETVPDRDRAERDRQGALLAINHAPGERWRLAADVYYLDAEDVPDLGSYFDRDAREPVEDIPVYAQAEDFLNSEALSLTLRGEYTFNEDTRIYAAVRAGDPENGYLATGARGTTRDLSDPEAPGADTISLSTHQGWQDVEYSAAQFNLIHSIDTGGIGQRWVFGVDYIDEQVDNGVYDIDTLGTPNCRVSGRRGVSDGYCVLDGNGALYNNANTLLQRSYQRGESDAAMDIQTISAYAMNTLTFNEHWELFLGLRQDWFDYSNAVTSRGEASTYDYSDTLTNGHVGLVYNITEYGNVYATYSTASNINGGESDLGANCGYGGLCGSPDQVAQSDPEHVENMELGTKWQFFDEKLLATAALFQITKSDVHESVGDAYSNLGTLNTGKNEVRGVEFSLSGSVTEALSVQLSAALMDSEVTGSFEPANVGLALSNFADDSLFLQLRYQPNDSVAFGASYTYKSEMYGGQPDSAAGYDAENGQYSIVVPSYGVVDLFANWFVTDDLNLRLNVGNVTDEAYWTAAYRSGSFMYIGDARTVRASVVYEF